MRLGRAEFTNSMPPYLLFADLRASGENGGDTAAGGWYQRPLTTELVDTHNLGSLSSFNVTLQPGTYRFRGVGVLYYAGFASTRLWNVTDGTAPPQSNLSLLSVFTSDFTTVCPETMGRFTITTAKTFQLQYRVTNGLASQGCGVANGWGQECYATLEFWREP